MMSRLVGISWVVALTLAAGPGAFRADDEPSDGDHEPVMIKSRGGGGPRPDGPDHKFRDFNELT
ncbi:hypothetical protein ACYOEI_38020, partial [Singulisphaera rosea]